MLTWLLTAAETVAQAVQSALPPAMRGLTRVKPGQTTKARALQLVLPMDAVLQQTFDRPALVTADWTLARIEAMSPWDKDACLWDCRPDGHGLRVALLPRRAVTEAETTLGRPVTEVVAGPFRFRTDQAQIRRWRDRIALGFGLALALALGLAALSLQLATTARDRTTMAEAATAANAARLRNGIGPAQAALALLQRKTGGVTLGLAGLAAALPTDSYLTTLAVGVDGFEITGQTTRPEAIIPALSAAGYAGVDFAGPTAHDTEAGRYSFTIRGKLGAPP